MKSRYIIPIFVPHNGCPNQCVFCNQKKISGQLSDITSSDVQKDIEEYLEKNKNVESSKIEVAFYGGSFTGISIEQQIELLEAVKPYIEGKRITGIRISTRPDYIDNEILERLKKYGVHTIELGVQSMNNDVLECSQRGHDDASVVLASKMIQEFGIKLGLQMMIGLPNSDEEKEIETAKKFVEIKPDFVRIYPVLVVKETPLAEQYAKGEYIPYSLEKAVEISGKLLNIFNENDITVIRIGLQATENIDYDRDVVAGPFHPAFGELVEQHNIYRIVEQYIIKNSDVKNILILCNGKDLSKIIGNKRNTIIQLNQKYNVQIKTKIVNNIGIGEYLIKSEE